MAKILAYTVQAPAHLYPFVPILLELQKRGHAAVFSMFQHVEQRRVAGIRVRRLDWIREQRNAGLGAIAQSAPGGAGDGAGLDLAYGEPVARALKREIEAERPGLILVDPMLWGGMVAAEASGLPWVSLSHNPKTVRGSSVDARGAGLRPPRGAIARVWRHLVEAALAARADRAGLGLMNSMRKRWGLENLEHLWDYLRRASLTIATTAMPFEYPRDDWGPSVRFVGPIIWEPSSGRGAWRKPTSGRPIVLLAGSSIPEHGAARTWVQVAIEALAEEPYDVVATLPTGEIPAGLPANVHVERFVPHTQILPHAECVVCHGGSGIVHKALMAEVPVVAIPFAYDRFEVARRVDVSGAGVMLPGKQLTPARLRAAIRMAISRKPGALRVAAAFGASGGASAAADGIETLLERAGDPGVGPGSHPGSRVTRCAEA